MERLVSEAESSGDVASARRQSRARLDRLYRRYSSWLEARLRRRYGADAEDIVQDAWLKIAQESSYKVFETEVPEGKKLIDAALAVK